MRGRSLALVACFTSAFLLVSGVAPRAVRADGPGTAASEAASDPPPEPKKTQAQLEAEKHYKRARELYQLGRYREAIAQLEAALKFDPKGAELLYNLGLIREKLGDVDEAVAAYRRYLDVLGPDADPEEVAKIKNIIKRLEGAKTELKTREAKKTEHRFTPLSAGLFVGAGVAALGTIILGVAALGHDREARDFMVKDQQGLDERAQLVDRSKSEANLANLFGAVTLVCVGAGLTLYLTSEFQKNDDPTAVPVTAALRVSPLPRGGGAMHLEVTF